MKHFIAAIASLVLGIGLASGAMADVATKAYPGWDAPGNDVDSYPAGSAANCAQACLERGNCSGATYNTATGRCWVKSSTPSYARAADGVLILKIVAGRDGIDYPGGDYRNFQASTWENCSRACFVDRQCRAFTFNKATNTCWLKNQIVDAAFAEDGVAGKK